MLLYPTLALLLLASLPTLGVARCLKNVPEVNPKRFLNVEGHTLDIRLEVSRRVTHRLSTHVVRIFLEEVLGYSGVNVVEHEDLFNTTLIVDRLAGPESENQSTVPDTMVNLEVWVSPDTNLVSNLDVNPVRECGLIAPPGRFGWFIPRDLVRPHVTPAMDHWRVFASQATAGLFDVNDDQLKYIKEFTKNSTTNRYFCEEKFCTDGFYIPEKCKSLRHKSQPCALLLVDYTDITKFVVEDIRSMNLFVKVVWVGNNLKDLTDKLTKNYVKEKSNSSLVVLSLTPSDMIWPGAKTQYVPVTFPPCNTVQSPGCRYEQQRLIKLAWAKLEQGANPAYEAIHKIIFSAGSYYDLLDRYDKDPQDKNIPSIACDWLNANDRIWRRWIPRTEEKNELVIFGIFPISGTAYIAKGIVKAALMAVAAVNANETILRDYHLSLLINNGMCKADVVMKTFIEYILNKKYSKLVGVLGPACSETVEPIAGVTKHFKTVVISYSAEGSSFTDRVKYPYFFRTIGENKQYKDVYLRLFKQMGWKRVAALTEDGQKYTEYLSHMQDELQKEGISFIINRKFPRDREKAAMTQYLEDLKSKNARIIIVDINDIAARAVMCEAYQLKMTAKQGYVWFLPLWLSPNWYDTDYYNREKNETVPCNTSQMFNAINGHLALAHSYFAEDNVIMQENKTVGEWRQDYKKNCSTPAKHAVPESSYAGYAYDAVWAFAKALDTINKENQSYLSDIHSSSATQRYVDEIGKTDFQGVSGHIRFLGGGPSRVSTINVVQWLNNVTHIVGSFVPNVNYETATLNGGDLMLNQSLFTWFTENGQTPEDGTTPPARCLFQGFADLLSVQCDMAIVLGNLMIFGILGIVLLIAFIVIKRRYDKKVQLTQKYMKSLGFDLLAQSNMANLDKWEIPRDHVVINRKLGEGAFGTVYGGETYFAEKGWVAVAVKTLKVGSTTEEKLDFLSEAEVMKRFDHKNVVKLVGVCTKNEPVYTIMEFMLYGDLKNFLLGRRHLVNSTTEESDEIAPKKLTAMALDVAKALSYLADLKYVHRDVASRNCLVNANRIIKLGDFGMTRPMFENDYYKFNRKGMLPVRWMAPESLGLGIFTPTSDVWSFGVLLYEIITFGSFPFQGLSNNQVLEHVKQGNTLTIPQLKPQLEGLIRSCWHLDYKKRPQASEIVEVLANNPRLIYPCLDVPLASVQMEDTGQMEIQLPEKIRKCSLAPSTGNRYGRDSSFSENAETFFHPRDLIRTDSGTGSVIENGCGPCVRDPLLGSPRSSTSSSGMGLSKYVMLEHRDANQCDEYCAHDPAPNAVSMV